MSSFILFESVPQGYAKLATLISKEKDYAIFRKFSTLNARNLLYLQAELTDLESRLLEIDIKVDRANNGNVILSSWPRFAENEERRTVVENIKKTLEAYTVLTFARDTALLQYNQVLNLNAPTPMHMEGIRTWARYNNPISDLSKNYIEGREIQGDLRKKLLAQNKKPDLEAGFGDLASLNKPEQSWLARILRRSCLRWIFATDFIYLPDKKSSIIFYPGSSVDRIVTGIAMILSIIITVLAVITLHLQKRDTVRLSMIGMFALFLATVMAVCGAKRAEVIVGTV
ncbi:hypothetical protein K469DRAFT_756731, partial [Zopfia rhizophila CBS 207.26]